MLKATRLSGPAPLAVLFDASDTTVSSGNAFHQLGYQFDFGDERGQTWPISGLPKNMQSGGPIAAHVFDVPGTYTVRMRASSASASSDASVTITVQSPDSAYSGANTVCVSTSANYGGCPSGAAMQTVLPSSYAGKRVLLRRGESFGTVTIRHADDNAVVGAFGSGVKPKVERVTISVGKPPAAGVFADDVTVMDLDIGNGLSHETSGARHLYYRNDFTRAGGDNKINSSGSTLAYYVANSGYPASSFYYPREIFIVENVMVGSTTLVDKPHNLLFFFGSRLALMGNDLAKATEHNVRLSSAHKSFIAHNALRGQSSDGFRHALKVHGGGLNPYDDLVSNVPDGRFATSRVVVANNLFGDPSDNNSWTVAIAPQNESSEEGLEDVIVENNRFYRGPRTNTDITFGARRATSRSNTVMSGGTMRYTYPTYNLPAEWQGPYGIAD